MEAEAKITLVASNMTSYIRQLVKDGAIEFVKDDFVNKMNFLESQMPFLIVVTTSNKDLSADIANVAKKIGILVYVVDQPEHNDLNMPAVAKIGEIRVGISTGGLSPAMSGLIRRRIERVIKYEDIMQVRLQQHIRKIIKASIENQQLRAEIVQKIIRSKKIMKMLQEGKFENAKTHAETIMKSTVMKGR